MDYTPGWAIKGGSPNHEWNEPPNLSDWRAFVSRLSSEVRRHPNVLSLEIYNEENVKQWWAGTAADYDAVLAQGAASMCSANPQLQVLFGGMVSPDTHWIDEACATYGSGPTFDVLPFHAYPETWTPKDVQVENYLGAGYREFLNDADRNCGQQPIWINEAGFATTPGKTELDQANWWARAIATFIAAPRVEHIGIYHIKDAPKDKRVIGGVANLYLGPDVSRPQEETAFNTVASLTRSFKEGKITVADSELSAKMVIG